MSANGYEKSPLAKRTIEVPDRTHTKSAGGSLPRREVSVAAAPWDLKVELNRLGVVEPPKGPILKGARPGKLPPDPKPDPKTAKGRYYRNDEEPEF